MYSFVIEGFLILLVTWIYSPKEVKNPVRNFSDSPAIDIYDNKDTCVVEGQTFRMLEAKSGKKLKAIIRNNQIVVINQGVQFAKYRVIYYVFSSMDDEQMPVIRSLNQRLSPPVLKVLKNSQPGNRFIFEEITVVDADKKELANAVMPLMIERIKNIQN
ncbi:MAG: hypothetical protein U0W24_09030 [Bacteroidales bacterium]